MSFDHLTTQQFKDHIARLTVALAQPSGIAYPLADRALDHKERDALKSELRTRGATR